MVMRYQERVTGEVVGQDTYHPACLPACLLVTPIIVDNEATIGPAQPHNREEKRVRGKAALQTHEEVESGNGIIQVRVWGH